MQEADNLGILDASPDVYQQALNRIEKEVAKVPAESQEEKKENEDENADLDRFGDEMMTKMMQEGSTDESDYVIEYNEVVAEISKICNVIMTNQKAKMQ